MRRSPLHRWTPLVPIRESKYSRQNKGKLRQGKGLNGLSRRVPHKSPKTAKFKPLAHKLPPTEAKALKKGQEAVAKRSGGQCELPGCNRQDWRGLQFMHFQHHKMGGQNGEMAQFIHDPRNMALVCAVVHDIVDGRVKSNEATFMRQILEKIANHESWEQEYAKRSSA